MRLVDLVTQVGQSKTTPQRAYIIAEAGVNHQGSMETARRLVREAFEGGADAIKFQTYKADLLACRDSPAYWDTSMEPTLTQHALFSKNDKFWKSEMTSLKEYCDQVGIEFMSTPFDVHSAEFLNDLMSVYKISSSDITNKPFIEFICRFKKPVVLSTGASHLWEIERAVDWIRLCGNPTALLHCVLNYPTSDANANLGMIQGLKNAFPDITIGYSDHTLPNDMHTCEAAFLMGAKLIEKHFTHDKTLPGNDHYHAMDMNDLKVLRSRLERSATLLGTFRVGALPEEEAARLNARRSLVAAKEIPAGKVVEMADLTFKRPAHGICPSAVDELLGMRAVQAIAEDSVLKWSMFS